MRVHKLEELTSHKTKHTSYFQDGSDFFKFWLRAVTYLCLLELCVKKGGGLPLDSVRLTAKMHDRRRKGWW